MSERGHRILQAVAVIATTAVVSLGLVSPTSAGPSRTAVPASATATWTFHTYTAAGVRQWMECGGSGLVTVIVIPGLHASHTMWARALPGMARETRTCVYDRPGMGRSPGRHPHRVVDAGLDADELWALLQRAHITTPLVVVGHSYGGLIARAFAARHRSSVAGVMLVEGVSPYDSISHYWHEGGDTVDTWASQRAALPLRLGSTPLVVEAAQDPNRSYWGGASYGETASEIAEWRAQQQRAASLSTDSTYVIVRHAAHVIEYDRPDAVIAGIHRLVRAITHHVAMPRCALGHYGSQPLC